MSPIPPHLDFVECSICAAKPGSPTLCRSCLHNRDAIYQLWKAMNPPTLMQRLRRKIAGMFSRAAAALYVRP